MRVLIIAYYYPPVGGGGSLRPARWAAALPQLGHEVVVLSQGAGPDRPAGSVIRIADPSGNSRRRGVGALRWVGTRALTELRNRRGDPRSVLEWWRRRAERALPGIIDGFRPDVVIASYSPAETLELGLAISRRHALPLVADFRDGLVTEPIESQRMARYPCVAGYYRQLEEQVMQRAAAVTSALPGIAEDLCRRYQATTVTALPNCFDPREWEGVQPAELDADQIHMVHTGSFAASDAGCDITPLVRAMEQLIAAEPGLAHRLRFHQLGRLRRSEHTLLRELSRRGVVVEHGVVDRQCCLAFQKRADLALLVTSTTRPAVIPGKLFEYLGAGSPVLALAEGTSAAEIVAATGVGWTVAPDDQAAIVSALARALDPRLRAALTPDATSIARFSLAAHTATLDRVLRKICADEGTRDG